MVVGRHGVLGVVVRIYVVKHFDQEYELVQILNQKIMGEFVLDQNVKKNHVRKLFVQLNRQD
jgi:hypothetical protein